MSGLNLNCTIHYNKWNKYVTFFGDNAAPVGLRAIFKAEANKFTGWMGDEIKKVAERANYDLDGITINKDNEKTLSADALAAVTSNAKSFADFKNLSTLKTQMKNATGPKLVREKDDNFVGKCNSVNTILTQVLADYPVEALDYFTATDLSDAMDLVGDFETQLGLYYVKLTDVNNAKIEFELEWMPKVNTSLEYLEGLLPGALTTTYPTFVKGFITLKKLVRAGVKDQGIYAYMVDSITGKVIIKVGKMETMDYDGAEKVLYTNNNGDFKLMRLKIGVWEVKYSAPGYDEQVVTTKITRRKVELPKILLVKTVVDVA